MRCVGAATVFRGAVVDADLIALVDVAPARDECDSGPGPAGRATAALVEEVTLRPVVVTVSISDGGMTGDLGRDVHLLAHEVMHSLVFSLDLFRVWPDVPERGGGSGEVVVIDDTPTARTNTTAYLTTRQAAREARAHFACESLPGVLLEDGTGTDASASGTALSHYEFSAFHV